MFSWLKNISVSYWVILLLLILSISSLVYFFVSGQHLLYADSISRLNIARKAFDNLTPGFAQLGNVWLPLPQILMFPFIWNQFMWHSGLAGSLMSMTAFVIGGIYIYKSAYLITNSKLSSLFSLFIYCLNINILYLQTTAMSESLFVCTLAGSIYYLLLWTKTKQSHYLYPAAISFSAMTLTRYEGLAFLLATIPMVFVLTYFMTKNYHQAEGNTIFFTTLACLGFGLWTLYLTLIFGDPLYWKNYYATPQATGGATATYTQAKPFIDAVWQYLTSVVWMNGLIPVIMVPFALIVMTIKAIRERSLIFLPILAPLSIFLFMVLTLQRNTPIVQPNLNLTNILSSETSFQTGFNVRYGLLLLPWIAIVSSFLFGIRFLIIKILLLLIFSIQIFSYFYPNFTVIYRIPARIYAKPYADLVNWMGDNYDNGLILVSASSHEDQMFQMGFNYRTYIHEGTGKYWDESLDNPAKYATWVIIDYGHPQDMVRRELKDFPRLERDFSIVYDHEQVKIYKIKTKPEIQITKN